MKLFKKTVAWVIILFILAGLSYFFEDKIQEKEASIAESRRLVKLEIDEIESVELRKPDGTLAVKKSKGGWFIDKPFIASADQKAITDMLDHTLRANINGVLFEEATEEKLKEMGLSPPYLTASLKTISGKTVTMHMGDRGPTQNIAFLKFEGEKRLLRVHADVRSELDKSVYDLRDKTVISIDPQTLKMVEMKWRDGETITVFQSRKNAWNTEGLFNGKTDLTKLLATLYGIRDAEAKAFIDENPGDMKPYGLHAPRLTLTFGDKNLQQILYVGDKDKKRRGYYANRRGDLNVFLLEEDFLDNIPDSFKDLEVKVE